MGSGGGGGDVDGRWMQRRRRRATEADDHRDRGADCDPACLGLQNCDLGEIFKAEQAAGCSCCASQLCNCTASGATDHAVFALDAAQREAGETPQCDINGTLCGTPP